MFQRYIVYAKDKRVRHWWKKAAMIIETAPESFRPLILDQSVFCDMSYDECMAVDDWAKRNNLGPPPLAVLDREDSRPKARRFVGEISRAMAKFYACAATRELLMQHDKVLEIEPDLDDEDVWHCRLSGEDWSWDGLTPMLALGAMMDSMADDLLAKEPMNATAS